MLKHGAQILLVLAAVMASFSIGLAILLWIVAVIASIITLLAALWCVWDVDTQCLWDKPLDTFVISNQASAVAPVVRTGSSEAAQNLDTLADLHQRGLITDAEYEERRQRELERL